MGKEGSPIDDDMITEKTSGADITGEKLKTTDDNANLAEQPEKQEIDPETKAEILTIEKANSLIEDGINKDDPEKIIQAIEIIDDAPDTVTIVRQRDDSKIAAAKKALKEIMDGITNLDNWYPPKDRKRMTDLGSDIGKACRILWNRGDKSLFKELTTISKHFHNTHGLGRVIAMLKGEDLP